MKELGSGDVWDGVSTGGRTYCLLNVQTILGCHILPSVSVHLPWGYVGISGFRLLRQSVNGPVEFCLSVSMFTRFDLCSPGYRGHSSEVEMETDYYEG